MNTIEEIQKVIDTYNMGILTQSETLHQITSICIEKLNVNQNLKSF
jgi:hypothetical protein